MTLEDRLRSVASEYSMPANAKLDALGIDVDVTTLPTWQRWQEYRDSGFAPVSIDTVESVAVSLAQDAMWRVAQNLAQALLYGDPPLIGKEIDT